MKSDRTIKVVIVDDDYVVRMGLSMALESAPGIDVVGRPIPEGLVWPQSKN